MARLNATLAHQPIAQRKWWAFKSLAARIADALGERPAVMVQGNHDCFGSYPALIRRCGATVHTLAPERAVDLYGQRFAGFREVPWMAGRWPGETQPDAFEPIVQQVLAHDPTVLVTHAPPRGVLDDFSDALHTGIDALSTALARGGHRVSLHLFGHVHEHGGQTVTCHGVRHVNGATRMQIVTLDP